MTCVGQTVTDLSKGAGLGAELRWRCRMMRRHLSLSEAIGNQCKSRIDGSGDIKAKIKKLTHPRPCSARGTHGAGQGQGQHRGSQPLKGEGSASGTGGQDPRAPSRYTPTCCTATLPTPWRVMPSLSSSLLLSQSSESLPGAGFRLLPGTPATSAPAPFDLSAARLSARRSAPAPAPATASAPAPAPAPSAPLLPLDSV